MLPLVVATWLDPVAPEGSSLDVALDWAEKFGLPLHAHVCEPAEAATSLGCATAAHAAARVEQLCESRHVPWRVVEQATLDAALDEFLQPEHLCVIDAALPRAVRERVCECRDVSLLVCPRLPVRSARTLIVNAGETATFLETAGTLSLPLPPVILTVAPTEVAAVEHQAEAEAVLQHQGLLADFDYVVGLDVLNAVALEARVRRCGQVIVNRRPVSFLRRLLWGDWAETLLEQANPFAVLALTT